MAQSERHYTRALYIFHRDLRCVDNTGLYAAMAAAQEVIPLFVCDPRQVRDNVYRSNNAVQFLCASLKELSDECAAAGGKLYYMYDITADAVAAVLSATHAQAVYSTRDYTPFSRIRDKEIAAVCATFNADYHVIPDVLLHEPEEIFTRTQTPYRVFTPFATAARTHPVRTPEKRRSLSLTQKDISCTITAPFSDILSTENSHILVRGGRREGLRLLQKLATFADYDITRNIPSLATTRLSAHIKFGTISIREVYHAVCAALGASHTLCTQLYWRDFFTHVAWHFPAVFGEEFREEFRAMTWDTSSDRFEAWCEGRTGIPLIDAGMRELNTTGYMHNRVRMITASFLVKDLHIDWRWGEKYFAQRLTDYDPCVNNGNWQWAASTGCDAQPWFRIFNPWLQQKKYDKDGTYIRQWVPELRGCDAAALHAPQRLRAYGYIPPVVDHAKESAHTRAYFKDIQQRQKRV